MITVEVYLFANLRKYASEDAVSGSFRYRVEEGTTVDDLRRELGVPEEECKQAFINRIRRDWSYKLQEGDRVALFSPIAGGSSNKIKQENKGTVICFNYAPKVLLTETPVNLDNCSNEVLSSSSGIFKTRGRFSVLIMSKIFINRTPQHHTHWHTIVPLLS